MGLAETRLAWRRRCHAERATRHSPRYLRQVERILRSFGVQGIFDRVTGVLVGRARDHSAEEKAALEAAIRGVVAEEFGRPDLPIVANLPFGHTDPQWVLPLGVQAELDVDAQTLRLIEPWLA